MEICMTISHENIKNQILDCIISYIEKHGYAPTYREIGNMVGLKSTATVHSHMTKMLEKGMLETDSNAAASRAIRVPGYKFVKY